MLTLRWLSVFTTVFLFSPSFFCGSVLLICFLCCIFCFVLFVFVLCLVLNVTISAFKNYVLLSPVVCKSAHVLFTLVVFAWIYWCPTHIVLCFCFVFLRLVYPILPVSLNGPFFIASSVFYNVYLSVSLDCSFLIAPSGIL